MLEALLLANEAAALCMPAHHHQFVCRARDAFSHILSVIGTDAAEINDKADGGKRKTCQARPIHSDLSLAG